MIRKATYTSIQKSFLPKGLTKILSQFLLFIFHLLVLCAMQLSQTITQSDEKDIFKQLNQIQS